MWIKLIRHLGLSRTFLHNVEKHLSKRRGENKRGSAGWSCCEIQQEVKSQVALLASNASWPEVQHWGGWQMCQNNSKLEWHLFSRNLAPTVWHHWRNIKKFTIGRWQLRHTRITEHKTQNTAFKSYEKGSFLSKNPKNQTSASNNRLRVGLKDSGGHRTETTA